MHGSLLHNGEIRKTSDALIAPGQAGFMNGWGVFSTLRVADGVLFAWPRHYQRLQRDAERMHVPFLQTSGELQRDLLSLVKANLAFNATLRVAVMRNRGGLFEAPGLTREADVIAFTADLNDWGAGVKVGYMPNARFGASPFAGTKYTSWGENLTLYEKAHQHGFDEFILLNEAGQVSECTSANVFAVQGGRVLTPPLSSSGCLPGITRALLLEEVHVPGLQICEQVLTPSDLEGSDAVFISSTTRDLLPVLSIDGLELHQSPAQISLLQNQFQQLRRSYVAAEFSRSKTCAV